MDEARAKPPPTLPSGTVAGRPTIDRAEPRLVLENAAERALEPAAPQLTNFILALYIFWQLLDSERPHCSERLKSQ